MSANRGEQHAVPIMMCTDFPLPPDLDAESQLEARLENPANIFRRPDPDAPLEMAVDVRKCWRPGSTLSVCFLERDEILEAKVATFAQLWCKHANIKFIFDNRSDADIRIAFVAGAGSKSRVGIDARKADPGFATMNLDRSWFRYDYNDRVLRRTVLHEFGHALGCIHEHQSPKAGIAWNEKAVFAYYGGPPNNWSTEQIRFNVLDRYNQPWMNATEFDNHSIMLYPIDAHFTTNGYSVGWNDDLSEKDISFIAKMYPFD